MTKRSRYFVFGAVTVLLVGLCTGLVAYYTGLPMGAFAQSNAPQEMRFVPADAAVVAYADVQAVMRSDLRRKVHGTMPDHDKDGQREFEQATGINIETDIDRVVAFLEPGTGDNHTGMVVAAGRFDVGRLEAFGREHGATIEDYRGVRVISRPTIDLDDDEAEHAGRHRKGPNDIALAFLEPGLVALGETDVVKRAIDRRGQQSVLDNQELMTLIGDLDAGNVWAVGRFDALVSKAHLPEGVASQIPSIRWFSASGRVNGGLSGVIRAETRDEQAGQNLRDVVQGFLALARLQANSKPELQAAVNAVQLSGTGKTVALRFDVPPQLLDLMEQATKTPEDGQ